MKCPYCFESFHNQWQNQMIAPPNQKAGPNLIVSVQWCPCCKNIIAVLGHQDPGSSPSATTTFLIPRSGGRRPCPPEVSTAIRADYAEACEVLPISPKASAALSRRCLQAILREKARVREKTLYKEIEKAIEKCDFPSDIEGILHAVREIGNFGAHPETDDSTGMIVDVNPGEADWNLEVIERLFDFFWVRPASDAKRKQELNEKLVALGKNPLP